MKSDLMFGEKTTRRTISRLYQYDKMFNGEILTFIISITVNVNKRIQLRLRKKIKSMLFGILASSLPCNFSDKATWKLANT